VVTLAVPAVTAPSLLVRLAMPAVTMMMRAARTMTVAVRTTAFAV